MPHGLPMATDRAHVGALMSAEGEQFVHRAGKMPPDGDVGRAESVDFVFAGHGERDQLRAQFARIRQRVRGDQFDVCSEFHQSRIDCVDARAGKHSDEQFVFRPRNHRPTK